MFSKRTEQPLSITARQFAVDAFVSLAVIVSVGALFVLIAGLKEHQQLGRDVLLISALIAAPVTILAHPAIIGLVRMVFLTVALPLTSRPTKTRKPLT